MTPGILQETTKEWQGCYSDSWKGLISPESFQHPAKMARGLARQIYAYMLEQGYIKVGDIILDPFAGIGGTCLDALASGLSWVGMELEVKFCDMGNGCECTGISPYEWLKYGDQFKPGAFDAALPYSDGHHWCPACIAGAMQIAGGDLLTGHRQSGLFDTAEDSRLPAGFKLAEDGTPFSPPHAYEGNLTRFKKYAQPGTTARLVQGDSRRLRQRLAEVVGGLVSSPPYSTNEKKDYTCEIRDKKEQGKGSFRGFYGHTEGQLAKLTEGNLDGAISSPPYANSLSSGEGPGARYDFKSHAPENAIKQTSMANYGRSADNLGNLPEGNLDSLITSPPFAGNTGGRGAASRNGIDAALFDRHSGGMKRGTGENPDNLDHLPMRGFGDALVSSPPFLYTKGGVNSPNLARDMPGVMGRHAATANSGYGGTEGQLSDLPEGNLDGSIGSPPFADSVGSDTPEKRGGLLRTDPRRAGDRNLTGSYGASEGQLGAMKAGGLVSSPPFENCNNDIGAVGSTPGMRQQIHNSQRRDNSYGVSGGQLGAMKGGFSKALKNLEQLSEAELYETLKDAQEERRLHKEQGQTFWAAAKQIVTESYLALKPGAYSAWVCKKFVRDGCIVDFPDQWKQLCESVGFEYVETIRAMLVSPEAQQGGLDGGSKTIQKQKKSFFRRLAEKNGSPRIDFEEVVILRKPTNGII